MFLLAMGTSVNKVVRVTSGADGTVTVGPLYFNFVGLGVAPTVMTGVPGEVAWWQPYIVPVSLVFGGRTVI